MTPHGSPPSQAPAAASASDRPGYLIPGLWLGLSLIVTLLAVVGVGVAAYGSERAGTTAAMVATFPVGFCWSGLVASGVVTLLKKRAPVLSIGAPIGCGLLGGVVLAACTLFFFAVIFPAL